MVSGFLGLLNFGSFHQYNRRCASRTSNKHSILLYHWSVIIPCSDISVLEHFIEQIPKMWSVSCVCIPGFQNYIPYNSTLLLP